MEFRQKSQAMIYLLQIRNLLGNYWSIENLPILGTTFTMNLTTQFMWNKQWYTAWFTEPIHYVKESRIWWLELEIVKKGLLYNAYPGHSVESIVNIKHPLQKRKGDVKMHW